MTTFKHFKRGLIVISILVWCGVQGICSTPADAMSKTKAMKGGAGTAEPVEESRNFLDDFSNSTFSGYIIDGEQKAYLENITIYEPEDEKLFGIPLNFARFKAVSFDGENVVDDLLLIGEIGSSNTFFLSYRKLDEPFDVNAGGVLYNITQHWDEDLPPVYLGVYLMEPSKYQYAQFKDDKTPVDDVTYQSGNLLYTLYGEYEIATGYYLGADILLGMESALNRDFIEGKVWGKHNFEPDGSTYGEIFVINVAGKTTVGGGVGFTF